MFSSKEFLTRIYKEVFKDLGSMPRIRKIKILIFISNILSKFNIDVRKKIFNDILKNFGKNINSIVLISKESKNKILKELWNFGIETVQCYDFPEASSIVLVNNRKDFIKDNIIGIPLPGIKARVLKRNNKAMGEFILQGDNIMTGYYNDRKSTKKVLEDGILYTGKTTYRDKNGYFYCVGKNEDKS